MCDHLHVLDQVWLESKVFVLHCNHGLGHKGRGKGWRRVCGVCVCVCVYVKR